MNLVSFQETSRHVKTCLPCQQFSAGDQNLDGLVQFKRLEISLKPFSDWIGQLAASILSGSRIKGRQVYEIPTAKYLEMVL